MSDWMDTALFGAWALIIVTWIAFIVYFLIQLSLVCLLGLAVGVVVFVALSYLTGWALEKWVIEECR